MRYPDMICSGGEQEIKRGDFVVIILIRLFVICSRS